MRKILISFSLFFSVAFLSAENMKFFSTNTFMDNTYYYLYKEFDESSFTDMYKGLDEKNMNEVLNFHTLLKQMIFFICMILIITIE